MEVVLEGVRFERDHRVVLDIPFARFAPGETSAVLGSNGAGKTTLLRLIAGIERPTAGVVRIGGAALGRPDGAHRPTALCFQRPTFVRGTVRENLDLALRLRAVGAADRRKRIEEVAAHCGIAALLERSAARLSGGEAQRTSLARTLVLRAPVTLLDEPLSGVDAAGRARLLHELPGLLSEYAGTAIVVTHQREEAVALARSIIVLSDGNLRGIDAGSAPSEGRPA
ncbi:MAG TPA: ATP-binding cassette domain-containing protein [Gemmatimonadales bacterium]|nr:ATP-binding cassette domain-containing protein [Gemmatimonadales bacterium]